MVQSFPNALRETVLALASPNTTAHGMLPAYLLGSARNQKWGFMLHANAPPREAFSAGMEKSKELLSQVPLCLVPLPRTPLVPSNRAWL